MPGVTGRPRLRSVSAFPSTETVVSACEQLYETSLSLDIALVVGGRALTEEVRRQIRYAAYCDTLDHLVSFARTLLPAERREKLEQNAGGEP